MIIGSHTGVLKTSISPSSAKQQMVFQVLFPEDAGRITGITAFTTASSAVKTAFDATTWSETVAGHLWLKRSEPIPFFHFQQVDLVNEWNQNRASIGIPEFILPATKDFFQHGHKITPMNLNVNADRGHLIGIYRDVMLDAAAASETYTVHLYFYYERRAK